MAVLCKSYLVLMIVQGALSLSDTMTVEAKKLKSHYYELDAEKLRDLWHNAMIRGLIKAHVKEILSSLPRIEQIVYKQCEKDARTTVALAKCAIRVFDARDNAVEEETLNTTTDTVLLKNFTVRRRPDPKAEEVLVEENNAQAKKNEFFLKYSMYSTRTRLLNPIRRQIRRNRTILAFTNEVIENREKEIKEEISQMSRKRKRKRRDNRDESAGSSPNLRRVAMKYVGKVLGEKRATSHLSNLRLIRDHFNRVEKINKYFKHMNEQNRGIFESAALGIDSRTPEITNNAVPVIEQVLSIVNSFSASKSAPGRMSILSPRVLSLFPEPSHSSKKRLLSPTFFSFQKDGFLSLPELFDIITTNQRYQQLMVDIVMDISGAGAVLEKLVNDLRPEIEDVKNVKLPLVEQLSKRDMEWARAHDLFNEDQTKQYHEKGYALLTEDQLNLIYSKNDQDLYGMNVTRLGAMSELERVQRLERDIRAMAALDRPKWPMWDSVRRQKRQTHDTDPGYPNLPGEVQPEGETHAEGHAEGEEHEERINGVLYETLRPYAFTTFVGKGGVMEAFTLSPHAFVTELAYPEALMLQTLSPRAFVATILSPAALIARILSPTALRAEVLSPRALHTWILSPEALVAEVLSPRFLDPRVLSPEALVIDVLSPGFLSPHVLSSENIGLIILSPNILSPRIASEEKLLVEILSPHILGGPHTHEEASHEVVEVGAHSPIRESTEVEHEEHEAIHRGHSREEEEEREEKEDKYKSM
ncbi:unnamed protein product [Cylicocyclus nassatus]|uniref:Uncharacterized protein n=1 Tax=Cylicocyclus nassatus TaxID=53992 RepID=A0AA36HE76_CYLNA|nr:unnamed protein product [Cylicocyclus nassatus]